MAKAKDYIDAATREPEQRFSDLPKSKRRRFSGFFITAVTALALFGFLLPIGYMAVTSLKTQAMIADPSAPIWPASPATIEFDLYEVPIDGDPTELALIKEVDGASLYLDPANAADGLIPLEGDFPRAENRTPNSEEEFGTLALEIFSVPIDEANRDLAMVKPGRQESLFLDPGNPEAGVFPWEGNWRLLEAAYKFDPVWENFGNAWTTMNFPLLLRNTLIIAVIGTFGAVVSSIFVAYGLARFRVPFKRTIMVVLIATIILPRFVTLVPTYTVFFYIGWVGTFLPLIVPHFFANAFNVFLLRQYFLTIPKELDEAATIDGAGSFRTLWSVILPQMTPAIVAVCLFHFFFAWNDFFEPMVYLAAAPDLQPISVGLQVFNSIYDSQPHLIQAGAWIAIAIPVIVFFFAQRVFLKGIDLSGVQK